MRTCLKDDGGREQRLETALVYLGRHEETATTEAIIESLKAESIGFWSSSHLGLAHCSENLSRSRQDHHQEVVAAAYMVCRVAVEAWGELDVDADENTQDT